MAIFISLPARVSIQGQIYASNSEELQDIPNNKRNREREVFYVNLLRRCCLAFSFWSSDHLKVSFFLSLTTHTQMLIIVWDHHDELQLFSTVLISCFGGNFYVQDLSLYFILWPLSLWTLSTSFLSLSFFKKNCVLRNITLGGAYNWEK